ncbi:MAG: SDR family NAD(P)-dependent oxidoreductase [Pirellulaceae bacterium]|nr:SDR family NAD(P)-dependent oxidoreductase [Pirellulaceae bacterium]
MRATGPVMTSRRVLVTGAAGFIGSHLTDRLLAEGCSVVGLDNFNDFYAPDLKQRNIASALPQQRFTLVEVDIRDRKAVREVFDVHRPESVVHLAAMAGVRRSMERPDEYAAVNVGGTVNLLDAAVAHGCGKFIFASSSSVYGNNKKVPFSERDPVDHPISPYAATKRSGELLCHTYWHLYQLPVFCLRLFTVYGPRQRPDLAISTFLNRVHDNKPLQMYGDGSASRDYTYVSDIVGGFLAALQCCDRFGLYNLGGNQPVKLAKLILMIEQITGKTPAIEQRPMQPGDVMRTWADLTRSGLELKYEPSTSLADGMAQQWQWMQQEGTNGHSTNVHRDQ